MSRMITSGASKPKTAGLPVLSFRMVWPSRSIFSAVAVTGPRMS